ncbi:MAG: hypothetical protein K2X80_03695 [Pseudomonadaceae bacterium]|nr:hypothetical protein [Pseudomonadaceae bacterium]
MSSSESLGWVHLMSIIGVLPLLLVWLFGVALCLQFWQRHNRACLWALIALLTQLAWTGLRWLLNDGLPGVLSTLGFEVDNLLIFMLLNLFAQLLNAACWAMLLWALRLALQAPAKG